MAPRRTARGKIVDMDALVSAHEHAIAVTGTRQVRMNARGDILGRGGEVAVPVERLASSAAVEARRARRRHAVDVPPAHVREALRKTASRTPDAVQAIASQELDAATEPTGEEAPASADADDGRREVPEEIPKTERPAPSVAADRGESGGDADARMLSSVEVEPEVVAETEATVEAEEVVEAAPGVERDERSEEKPRSRRRRRR